MKLGTAAANLNKQLVANCAGVRDLSIIPEEMSEGHSPRAIGEEQPGLEPHLDQGDPAVMAASLHPVSTDVHIPG